MICIIYNTDFNINIYSNKYIYLHDKNNLVTINFNWERLYALDLLSVSKNNANGH